MPLDPEKIQAALDAKKLTRADLSRLTGMAPPHVTRILSGKRNNPSLSTAEKIAAALKLTITEITVGQSAAKSKGR